jgi:hypothetical protein
MEVKIYVRYQLIVPYVGVEGNYLRVYLFQGIPHKQWQVNQSMYRSLRQAYPVYDVKLNSVDVIIFNSFTVTKPWLRLQYVVKAIVALVRYSF